MHAQARTPPQSGKALFLHACIAVAGLSHAFWHGFLGAFQKQIAAPCGRQGLGLSPRPLPQRILMAGQGAGVLGHEKSSCT